MEKRRGAYEVLVVKSEGMRPLGILKRRRMIILKQSFKKSVGRGLSGLIWLRNEASGGLS